MISNKLKLMIAASVFGVSSVFAGTIAGSPHDLSGNAALATDTADNGEICVYCHTPHAANTAFTGAPLWNKGDAALTDYMMYGASVVNTAGSTIAGTSTAATPASPSLACLSCHDGASAIDSIVNAPGSGMREYATAGVTDITEIGTTYGGNIGGTVVDAGLADGTTTTTTTTGNVNLSNDHPVSITYTEGTAGLVATTTALTGWIGASTVGDLLRGATNDQVECGSCHDPHNGGNTQGTSTEVNFLRKSNTGSALCLGCHNK
ncbi:MAG: cytochrome c3 family protein [Sulfurimonas sp.]